MIVVTRDTRRSHFILRVGPGMTLPTIGDARNQQISRLLRFPRLVAIFAFHRHMFGVRELSIAVPNARHANRRNVPGIVRVTRRSYLMTGRASLAGEQTLSDNAGLITRPCESFLLF